MPHLLRKLKLIATNKLKATNLSRLLTGFQFIRSWIRLCKHKVTAILKKRSTVLNNGW